MKEIEAMETVDDFSENFNFYEPEISCKKHPSPSSVGICAHCLRDRLVRLVCPECGEQRLSSCSCSDISSLYRNSCSTMEVGSVGRISFLIENEKTDQSQQNHQHSNPKKRGGKSKEAVLLRRSSSSCAEVESRGFWRIKWLFRRKRNKGSGRNGESCELSDILSRSRSLCSLRGGKRLSFLDEGSDLGLSSAKISDVSSGVFIDPEKQWELFGESERRKSGFKAAFVLENGLDFRGTRRDFVQIPCDADSIQTTCVFPVKESEFRAMDKSAFIDLKLDLLPEPKRESSAAEASGHGGFDNGESCRITVDERGWKRGRRSQRIWKWIFKYHNSLKD